MESIPGPNLMVSYHVYMKNLGIEENDAGVIMVPLMAKAGVYHGQSMIIIEILCILK